MITKIEANKRHLAFHGWLKSFQLFSFADYYDPENMNFGSLRVFNDDWIDAQAGFGDHSHENMEIVTIVLEGEITHKDSMGNNKVIKVGEVQRMSAGTLVVHSELNLTDKPLHLYQIWIVPREQDLKPTYEQKDFSGISNKNILLPVAAGAPVGEALLINTDATIFTSDLEKGNVIEHRLEHGRGAFLYLREGALVINGIEYNSFDQARIIDEEKLKITAMANTKFVLIDVPLIELT